MNSDTHRTQCSTINDQDEASRPVAIIPSDQISDAGVDALQGIWAVRVRFRLEVICDARFVEDAARREELIDCARHLGIHGATAAASDDDDVVVTADEVGAVSDRWRLKVGQLRVS